MSKGSRNRSNPKKYRESEYWQNRAQERLNTLKVMGKPVEKGPFDPYLNPEGTMDGAGPIKCEDGFYPNSRVSQDCKKDATE